MITTQTIALLGGVGLLLVLLLVIRSRRAKAGESPAPARTPDVADLVAAAPPATFGPARLFAAEGIAEAPAAPVAMPAPAAEPALPAAWSEDEVVTEPGWLMPGEVDHAWQADFAAAAAPRVPVGAGAHVNGNGSGAARHEVGRLIDAAVGGFDPAAGWGEETTGTLTVERPAGDEEPADEPRIPQWDPVDEVPVADFGEPAAPAEELGGHELAMPAWEAPMDGWSEEPVAAEPAVDVAVGDAPAEWPEAPVDDEPAELRAGTGADQAEEEPDEIVAWWDLPDPTAAPAAAVAAVDAGTGRFALGGFALQPGHEAITGVTFRAPLPCAPAAWAVGPVAEPAPGTIVLSVDGAVNCAPEDVAVLMEDGFAPSPEGFAVRAAARAAGPFAASGTFRVA